MSACDCMNVMQNILLINNYCSMKLKRTTLFQRTDKYNLLHSKFYQKVQIRLSETTVKSFKVNTK